MDKKILVDTDIIIKSYRGKSFTKTPTPVALLPRHSFVHRG